MAVDHIRYDILAQDALRGVVRSVLADAAANGLPGEHHFVITFDTGADGVKMSPRLRAQFPHDMTIVLQHQFWDLVVTDDGFEVGLSFKGVPERLGVPFSAIKGFVDPAVQFALQFAAAEDENEEDDAAPDAHEESSTPAALPAPVPAQSSSATAKKDDESAKTNSGDKSGAEIVRLDRFRKK